MWFLIGPDRIQSGRGQPALPTLLTARSHIFVAAGGAPWAEALPEAEHQGVPMGALRSISYVPSSTALARSQRPTPRPAVFVADPNRNLPHAYREGGRLHARIGGTLLRGDAASRGAVLASMKGARLFHYAGHGVLRRNQPWEAHLVLARDERLSLEDILVQRPSAGLVVLNGCRTGLRLSLGAQETIGLPEALIIAGTRSVIAATRALADDELRGFTDAFYEAGGVDRPGEALRQAIRKGTATGDSAWRAFRLWGSPHGG